MQNLILDIVCLAGRAVRRSIKNIVPSGYRVSVRKPIILWEAAAGDQRPYFCLLIYRRSDPFAVTLLVPDHTTNKVTEVVFDRGLAIEGLDQPAGVGAVRIEPHLLDPLYSTYTLPLTPGGTEFFAERAPLEDFVLDTCALVPSGTERPQVTAALDRWLAGVAR
ncbi:SsgA family sporulation/cell division regulator [Nonomuraea zeae]|uniref:SsgA family sporulation/cell division regulator n=1 Tax=Nonomuraea zeae TaxID=1642303 RepID=A0A5S4H380_9ACTN|nr:SsgA family sporulation/cell division regulator [Nonomuraea zeae]TMR39587.1 SsgA family sporulation/cell division regulator [Nonomuraea zeae]